MKKAHKDFLQLTQTRETFRLVFSYSEGSENYRISLDSFYEGHWQLEGIVAVGTSFIRIEAVWVFLLKQDVSVWIKLKRGYSWESIH